ncbi:lipid IV(A) 3-deoxy-D-manno-octulosonic acid transferase [Vibrio sp. D420a]|uniref:lipid IV(A) 3-deoxy-D-manno-octulosonic acid transferase n=1 Tax=Vibrio sp. D420a TaxID=2836895 RepID=UPI0025550E85|nr:lipid IV(A) 3-deoxy-D-manno-octulosonic acid transferase [Vibrio sp. D420a]MDK9762834.1 lipid IV(A) 3-deoxy-D-manno-octulosonic acid transferase [Vibrio sp. D420a]
MLIRFFYTLILAFLAPLLLFGLYKSKPNKPKFGKRWKEHFGITPKLTSNQRPIWIHAVSVGESIASIPLIKKIKAQNPSQTIVVTTTTSTGAKQIEKLGDLVEHRYMPLDFPFAVRGFLRAINPSKMLIVETELWPNTLHMVHRRDIPIYVVNARLSEKSMKGYAKVKYIFKEMETSITKILCQSESDKQHFSQLGVSEHKLIVTGSIKFDICITPEILKSGTELREQLGVERPVWIAASTHQGEDEQILASHREILQARPNALLIIVPRHPERFDNVANLSQGLGFNTQRRSTLEGHLKSQTQVYIGDTMGEMLTLIGASDVCFMAGSLLGNKVGGHNVLEPVALNVPVISGPSYFNFKTIVDDMLSKDIIDITSACQLSHTVLQRFDCNNSELFKDFIQSYLHSTEKTIKAIQ